MGLVLLQSGTLKRKYACETTEPHQLTAHGGQREAVSHQIQEAELDSGYRPHLVGRPSVAVLLGCEAEHHL